LAAATIVKEVQEFKVMMLEDSLLNVLNIQIKVCHLFHRIFKEFNLVLAELLGSKS